MASRWVTVTHTGTPSDCDRIIRLAEEPCQYSLSFSRQNPVGVQKGWPSIVYAIWQTMAASRMS